MDGIVTVLKYLALVVIGALAVVFALAFFSGLLQGLFRSTLGAVRLWWVRKHPRPLDSDDPTK